MKFKRHLKLACVLFGGIVVLPLVAELILVVRGYNGYIAAFDMWSATESGALITQSKLLKAFITLIVIWLIATTVAIVVSWPGYRTDPPKS